MKTMNVAKLIDAVRRHEIIYNNKHPDFYDVEKRKCAWKNISRESGLGYEECRKKWSNIKTYYKNCVKNKKKWHYLPYLSFVHPSIFRDARNQNNEHSKKETNSQAHQKVVLATDASSGFKENEKQSILNREITAEEEKGERQFNKFLDQKNGCTQTAHSNITEEGELPTLRIDKVYSQGQLIESCSLIQKPNPSVEITGSDSTSQETVNNVTQNNGNDVENNILTSKGSGEANTENVDTCDGDVLDNNHNVASDKKTIKDPHITKLESNRNATVDRVANDSALSITVDNYHDMNSSQCKSMATNTSGEVKLVVSADSNTVDRPSSTTGLCLGIDLSNNRKEIGINCTEGDPQSNQTDVVTKFFLHLAEVVKTLPPFLQTVVKDKCFSVVSKAQGISVEVSLLNELDFSGITMPAGNIWTPAPHTVTYTPHTVREQASPQQSAQELLRWHQQSVQQNIQQQTPQQGWEQVVWEEGRTVQPPACQQVTSQQTYQQPAHQPAWEEPASQQPFRQPANQQTLQQPALPQMYKQRGRLSTLQKILQQPPHQQSLQQSWQPAQQQQQQTWQQPLHLQTSQNRFSQPPPYPHVVHQLQQNLTQPTQQQRQGTSYQQ